MQQETKKVLVTGATGFIGGAVVKTLAEKGWDVTKAVRDVDAEDDFKNLYLDLSKPESILSLSNNEKFDVVVHIGAYIGFSGQTESELFVPNVLSSGCLAYLAREWGAQFVFASAAIVHGARATLIGESSPLNTDTAYAKSKWLAEEMIKASGVYYCNLRIAGVFGKNGPEHLGINRSIDCALKGKVPVQIGRGSALRNYIYVEDVAETISYVVEQKLTGTHLVSGQERISINEMLQTICDIFISGDIPKIKSGKDGINQYITPSSVLPQARSFYDALLDIKRLAS